MARTTKAMLEDEIKRVKRVMEVQSDEIVRLREVLKIHEKYGQHAQNSTALMTIQETARAVSNIFQALPTAERMKRKQ